MSAKFLEEVLNACQNAGLQVVATAYDMGTSKAKALKLLCVTEMEHSSSSRTK
jgi:hypothetical protein